MSGRVYVEEEPLCVGHDTAAELLRRVGWRKCAELVAESGIKIRDLNRTVTELRHRLAQFEPPVVHERPRSYRSEWE